MWEVEVSVNMGLFTAPAREHLERLVSKLHEKSKGETHFLIYIDEISLSKTNSYQGDGDCNDFSILSDFMVKYPTIHIYMAVSPEASGLEFFNIILPDTTENFIKMRLRGRYRNCYPIAMFLAHLNDLIWSNKKHRNILDSSEDYPLDPSKLPGGQLPVWIEKSEGTTHFEVLKFLKEKYLKDETQVTILRVWNMPFPQEVLAWIKDQNWEILNFQNVFGSERENIIIVEGSSANLEWISRAKKRFFIVTM